MSIVTYNIFTNQNVITLNLSSNYRGQETWTTVYTADFSSSLDGWQINENISSIEFNQTGIDAPAEVRNGCLKFTVDNTLSCHSIIKNNILDIGGIYRINAEILVDSLNETATNLIISESDNNILEFFGVVWEDFTSDRFTAEGTSLKIEFLNLSQSCNLQGNSIDSAYISKFILEKLT